MSLASLSEIMDRRTRVMPLTVGQYHRMIRQGIIPEGEPYELLRGHIVRKDRSAEGEDPMTVGDEHIWVVQKLVKLGPRLARMGCHMRVQQPVSLPPYDEPEPDGAVVVGTEDDYLRRRPGARDVRCVIEVADSSLRRDRTTKARIYAAGGIGLYIIINLPERVVEVYSLPASAAKAKGNGRPARHGYGPPTVLAPGRRLELPAPGGKALTVSVRGLLPPR